MEELYRFYWRQLLQRNFKFKSCAGNEGNGSCATVLSLFFGGSPIKPKLFVAGFKQPHSALWINWAHIPLLARLIPRQSSLMNMQSFNILHTWYLNEFTKSSENCTHLSWHQAAPPPGHELPTNGMWRWDKPQGSWKSKTSKWTKSVNP